MFRPLKKYPSRDAVHLKKNFVLKGLYTVGGGLRGGNKGFPSIRKFSGWRAEFREFSISEKV
jgi:hypothetical protein